MGAWAQVVGPVLGYVPDSGTIRPVYGIPAAAAVMGPIDPRRTLASMAVSPHQDFVFGVAADSGAALLILPGVSTTPLDAVAPGPDSITMSPSGSAAILWWNSVSNFQIVGGLPESPTVLRTVNTSFLGASPAALAVSDDGQWAAGIWSTGVYAFGPDGQVNALPVQGAMALGFFHQRADLAVASATQISTVTDVGGAAAVSVIYDTSPLPGAPMSPLAVALSFDNRRVVVADASGTLVNVGPGTGTFATVNCACTPNGLFGMNGAVFRLTDLSTGALKLFDAASGDVYVAPLPAGGFTRPRVRGSGPTRNATAFAINGINSGKALASRPSDLVGCVGPPSVKITPTTATPAQQLPVTVTLNSPYPVEVDGTITLTFAPSVGVGDDPLIAFSTGGRTLNFTIPAGATTAVFSGTSGTVSLLTGTVAGTITLNTTLTFQCFTGILGPPQPLIQTITINPTPPVITSVVFNQPINSNTFTIVVTGFSDTRDMTSGLFHFAPTTGHTLAQSDITVPLSSAFATWYQNSASNAFGSEFTLTVPFTIQGPSLSVLAATVTLTNSKGVSNPSNPANP